MPSQPVWRHLATSSLLLLIGAPQLTAQRVAVERLEAASGRIAEPFTTLSGLRELSDGRVLVSDMTEARLRLLDFTSGASRDLGRRGGGPGEYERPNALYAAARDTTLLLDLRGRRLLTILPDGRLSDRETRLRMVSGGFKPPRGMDTRGRVYFDLSGIIAPGLERGARLGRVAVLRVDPGATSPDTVAELSVPPMDLAGGSGPLPPYRPEDAWAVHRDGSVAIVRHDPYRVEWFGADGRRVTGPPVDWQPVRIGRAERDAWLDRMSADAGIVVTEGGQRRTVRPPRPDAGSLDWPAVLPPFEGPAWISARGDVWVRRNRAVAESRPLYDVFDRAGRLIRQVELPAGRRVVGFGNGVVYAVRSDDFGLLWLERYAS